MLHTSDELTVGSRVRNHPPQLIFHKEELRAGVDDGVSVVVDVDDSVVAVEGAGVKTGKKTSLSMVCARHSFKDDIEILFSENVYRLYIMSDCVCKFWGPKNVHVKCKPC